VKKRLQRWLPSPERLNENRWLRWLGPALQHRRLWHFSRKGIALGVALGIFFGLLIPIGQIPLSATTAVLLRANLPVAVASTLVTNPVTFAPIYYGAYRLGRVVLGETEISAAQTEALLAQRAPADDESRSWISRVGDLWDWVTSTGKPLVVGLLILSTLCGLTAYALTSLLWTWHVRRTRRVRQAGPNRPSPPRDPGT
jgi:uncharacterized protein (DUF2062 family)